MQRRWLVLAAAVVMLLAGVAAASTIVGMPVSFAAAPEAPQVILQAGNNANQVQFNGQTLAVTIGANGTSASVSFVYTYQRNYIVDFLRIVNQQPAGGETYWVGFKVTPLTNPNIVQAYLRIRVGANTYTVDLLTASNAYVFQLAPGQVAYVDLFVDAGEGWSQTGVSDSFSIEVYYSLQNVETAW